MKIAIYNEARGGVGGSEFCSAVLAEAFSHDHDVAIVHHNHQLTKERIEELFSVRLDRVTLQYHAHDPSCWGNSRGPWRRSRELRAWQSALSAGTDLFIAFAHGIPPFCHAKRGVLVVLFPLFDRRNQWPWGEPSPNALSWAGLQRRYFDWQWRRRMATYQVKWAISDFTAEWTRRRWGIDCQVVYPPADNGFKRVAKERLIVSVGRFTPLKKQLDMLLAFSTVARSDLKDWHYCCIGGLGESESDREYFRKLEDIARQCGAELLPNADRTTVRRTLERAGVFWHAMGLGEDQQRTPELLEHFGICTVEAMAAGCVPVVINRGGQAEIVQNGLNGFVWDETSQMLRFTTQLAADEDLRSRMSDAACRRAKCFDRQRFTEAFVSHLTCR
jgi:glycosyltransferase involved in cell wall biosynthesis